MIRGFALLFVGASALRADVLPPQAPSSVTDAVARAFSSDRADAHLRPLTRIPERPVLRQIVCSAAANNSALGRNEGNATFIARESEADGALFAITDLAHLPADVRRVAQYDDRASARGRRITRFSVAAFASPADPGVTWIGIALYWSRFTELLARHTHTYGSPDLRYDIAPVCLSIR